MTAWSGFLTGKNATLFRDQIPKPIKDSQLHNPLVRITGVTVAQKPKRTRRSWTATSRPRIPSSAQ